MSSTTGVGVLGCGPVTQAIHLPTLNRVPQFRVTHVMDVDAALARTVARRAQSRWTTSVDDVLADPDVEVVLVCSPNEFHAEQVIAACHAGKRAVLCEKPLATSESDAGRIAEAVLATGVPVVVGAMHTFDPGWLAAVDLWGDTLTSAHTLRYSITLPPNPRFEDFATQVSGRPAARPSGDLDAEAAAGMIAGSIMGLAIHDLPLIRSLCPDWEQTTVLSAQIIPTGGYLIHLRVGSTHVRVAGVMTQTLEPEWRLEAFADGAAVDVQFPNSYVHAGSATAVLHEGEHTRTVGPFPENGYVGEWNYLLDLLSGRADPIPIDRLVDDVTFALRLADVAATEVRRQFDHDLEVAR